MKVIFNCHTEYDLNNKESFSHLPVLLNWLELLNIPMTFSLAVGGIFRDNLLKFIKDKKIEFSKKSEIAIHFHLEKEQYQDYFNRFQKILGLHPKTMVFGKWKIDYDSLRFLSELGIEKDGSLIESDKVIRAPFLIEGILEVPVVSFKGKPVNPFTQLSHFFLLRRIIKKYHTKNLICQIGFHSYDFFRFNQKPKFRLIKKIIFKNILKMIKQYNLEITTLSEMEKDNFEELAEVKMPLLGKLFNLIGH